MKIFVYLKCIKFILIVFPQDECSVDENSSKTDEEYEDLAIQDELENCCRSDDDELTILKKFTDNKKAAAADDDIGVDKYQDNIDRFLKMSMDAVGQPLAYSQRNKKGSGMTASWRSSSDSIQLQSRMQRIRNRESRASREA